MRKIILIIAIATFTIGAVFTFYSYHFSNVHEVQKSAVIPAADTSVSLEQYPGD